MKIYMAGKVTGLGLGKEPEMEIVLVTLEDRPGGDMYGNFKFQLEQGSVRLGQGVTIIIESREN